jgi:two-component system, sensor histidine kinase
VDRAHVLIRAEGRSAEEDDAAAAARGRLPHERERETLFAELTGHGFVSSMACAGTAALLALGGAFEGLVAYDRTATLALLTAVVAACLHALRGWRAVSAAALESGWVIWRHRAMLFVLGLCCAAASPAWAQQGAAASTVCVGMLMLIGGLGASSATADRCSLLLWVGAALGLPLALCLAVNSDQGRNAAWMLAICIIVILGLAGRVRRLVRRAWRVRQENDQLVAQLRQQVALVEAANNEKTRFLGAASHDLRQPMHALGLFAAALEKELRGSAHHAKVISMTRAVDALEDSFGAMLDVSKLDAGIVQPNLQTFPIRDVFRRLHMHCAGQAEEKGLSLRFKPGGKLVTSDPQLLERILANLVHNAIRYTNEGGVIAVARTRRDRTSIEVWDTGAGIAADELPQIFNEFYQVENQGRDRSKGLGMGLSIVKRLVLLLDYELEVASTPGRGTVFRVLLPPTQWEEMPSMVLGADTIPSAPEEGRTVLVIDDEAAVRDGMKELLAGWGYTVLLAGTIDEARAAVLGHNGLIDVVVSDLRLANSEDGLQAIDEVRRTYGAPLPALLITGDTSPAEVKRAHAGGHPVLFKPVRARDLFAALRHTP